MSNSSYEDGQREQKFRTRRNVLKASGVLLGASLLGGNSISRAGATEVPAQGVSGNGSSLTPPFSERMIGYMLAHEQFTVPQLVDFGVACEESGFDLLATSDHFQP